MESNRALLSNLSTQAIMEIYRSKDRTRPDQKTGSYFARKLNTGYSHMIKLIRKLEDMQILYKNKNDGRSHSLILTKKGERIAQLLISLHEELYVY